MEPYLKRGQWCARNSLGQLRKFTDKKDAMAFTGKVTKSVSEISQDELEPILDESDTIEEEKSISEKMKKAKKKPVVTLDALQGSYE
tara:strand:- start:71 stop:331 length:261 start_codon:yes stop_codon:yes gene_type:complete